MILSFSLLTLYVCVHIEGRLAIKENRSMCLCVCPIMYLLSNRIYVPIVLSSTSLLPSQPSLPVHVTVLFSPMQHLWATAPQQPVLWQLSLWNRIPRHRWQKTVVSPEPAPCGLLSWGYALIKHGTASTGTL